MNKLSKRQCELINYMKEYRLGFISSYDQPGADLRTPTKFFFRSKSVLGLPPIDLHAGTINGLIKRGYLVAIGDGDYYLEFIGTAP